jgi:hypothetical protein|tara:strand:+ start:120 stop:518 length:399 start_codon:yes stop_codon:yes gene_type:complete
MNTDTPYKIVKLTNGDDLICEVDDHDDIEYKINFPLKMEVSSMTTKEGEVDSLNLSRWIGPYTEQSFFSIRREHVLVIANASEGLGRYYEHMRRQIIQLDTPEKRAILDDINEEDIYDELLSELETETDTIH